ncbi:hypothetical protein [Methylocapsa acidiphila]|uniref:hypothetical protein n=1 Tax=Methylocapsa acidiphila TaxID=133552 RepID=UPI0004142C85|nr:hypothetical protein [Methylocapsa acidiphila]
MPDFQNRLNGFLQVVVNLVKVAVAVVLGAVVIGVAATDFKSITAASQQILAKASDARELDFAGFKLSLSESTVTEALAQYAADPSKISPEVTQAIRDLRPDEFARLMDVGQLDGLCRYQNPSARMLGDVALDYDLAAKGLTWIGDSPDTFASVEAYLAEKAAEGMPSPNGRPISCYQMTLTDLGRNVKTGLVQSFKKAFDPTDGWSAPSPSAPAAQGSLQKQSLAQK